MPSISRRGVLAGLTAAATAGLAGCLGDDGAFPDGDWPMPGRTPQNASALPETTLPNAVTEAWAAPVGSYWQSAPVVYDGDVAVATGSELATFDADSGDERMTRPLDAEVCANPAYDAATETLVVPTYDPGTDGDGGSVSAHDAASGEERWSLDAGDARPYSVRIADGVAYVRTSTACLAVATGDGAVRWRRDDFEPVAYEQYNAGEDLSASVAPTVAGDTVYVTDANRVRALAREDGRERWRLSAPFVLSAPAFDDDRLYVSEYAGDTAAFDADGEEVWRAPSAAWPPPRRGPRRCTRWTAKSSLWTPRRARSGGGGTCGPAPWTRRRWRRPTASSQSATGRRPCATGADSAGRGVASGGRCPTRCRTSSRRPSAPGTCSSSTRSGRDSSRTNRREESGGTGRRRERPADGDGGGDGGYSPP
nr:PQQ-binding-like beta-propeller repeat protein [Halogeometricum sp. CBA1124]